MDHKDFTLLKISLASLPCLSMLTLLKPAYSTRLKSSKHAKMSANDMTSCTGGWFITLPGALCFPR